MAVPGELRGMQLAHEKYGRLQWRELFQPAIKLASGGFEVTESLGIALEKWKEDVLNSTCLRCTLLIFFSYLLPQSSG